MVLLSEAKERSCHEVSTDYPHDFVSSVTQTTINYYVVYYIFVVFSLFLNQYVGFHTTKFNNEL